jgi:hypothetical protein
MIFDFPASLLDDFVSGETLLRQCSRRYRPTLWDASRDAAYEDGDVVFCKTDYVAEFFRFCRGRRRRRNVVLVTHNSDYPVDRTLLASLPSNVVRWFAINAECVDDRIEPIPIGLANGYANNAVRIEQIRSRDALQPRRKLLLVNHRVETFPDERKRVYAHFESLGGSWVTLATPPRDATQTDAYVDRLMEHRFVACPRGNGLDTHRVWEALYARAIPVLRNDPAYRGFTGLPVLFVDDWSTVTESLLERALCEMAARRWDFSKLSASWWGRRFRAAFADGPARERRRDRSGWRWG